MGHRGRSLRSDMEMSSAQGHGKGAAQFSSTVATHQTRPFRQFSSRSRTKSTASFKGLHRIVSNDGAGDVDNHILNGNGFKKSKSSDTLYRKRASSGLNMTTLAKVKSNPSQTSAWKSGSETSPNSFSMQSMGIKPSKNKSTHSVVDLRDGGELYDNESTTDEEVEYFTDEEEDDEHDGPKSNNNNEEKEGSGSINSPGGTGFNATLQGSGDSVLEQPRSVLLSKTFNELTLPFQAKGNEKRPLQQPSYKVPSNLIRKKLHSEGEISKEIEDYSRPDSNDLLNLRDVDDRFAKTGLDDGDDHISRPDMNAFDSNTGIENITHSLTRQLNHTGSVMTKDSPEDTTRRADGGDIFGVEGKHIHSNNEDYIADMILSQSTGMERRFEQPASIQNSLADGYPVEVMGENKKNTQNNDNDNHDKITNSTEDLKPAHQQFSKELTNGQSHFLNPVSGLTTSLQGTGTESPYASARMDNFLQKRASQNSMLRSDLRSLLSSERPNSSLHREHSSPSTNINNFGQFLKSDGMDGESRTQRKLWLQRENSIMDLSAQSDNSDPIFMANNVEVKREFERISHEYINVRRFSNPVEEALARVDTKHESIGINSSKKTTSDVSDVLFPAYGSRGTKVEEFLPQTDNTKLHRILSAIWKEESALFNKDTNPLNKQKMNTSGHFLLQSNRNSLRNMGSSTGLHHQRIVNSLQPTTRAVHRRMENNMHQQRT